MFLLKSFVVVVYSSESLAVFHSVYVLVVRWVFYD